MAAANASQSGSERAAVPHARWQLLEQVYRAYKLQQVSAAAADTAVDTTRAAITPAHKTGTTPTPVSAEPMSSAEQGNVSALTSYHGVLATKLVACLSFTVLYWLQLISYCVMFVWALSRSLY